MKRLVAKDRLRHQSNPSPDEVDLAMRHGHTNMTMVTKRSVPAGEFKARCLQLMDQVERGRAELVITKRGKPVAKLVPIEETPPQLFDCMKGTATLLGDVVAPAVPADEWEATD
jgi:prevent-host-death family protein